MIECPVLYKYVPIVIAEHEFPKDLIWFDMSEFDIILEMDWLTTREANIAFRNLMVTLKNEEGQEVCFYGERFGKKYTIISIMKVGKLLR